MPFRMFESGPIWKPPILVDYTQGMPEELINKEEKLREILQKSLSTAQRDHLEMLLHKLTPEKKKVAECLVFCMNHCRLAISRNFRMYCTILREKIHFTTENHW